MVVYLGEPNNKDGDRKKERERVLQAPGRVESPDSKRDLHIRFCNSVLHTSKA